MRGAKTPSPAGIACPVCGGENGPEAVFCANPACGKALGEFRYVREELQAEARWHDLLADRASAFIGKPHFLVAHALWFALWAAINLGLFAVVRKFDMYPFPVLGMILSMEGIFITGLILMSSNRQSAFSNKRGELDYEVSVRTYRELRALQQRLNDLGERLERIERAGRPARRE